MHCIALQSHILTCVKAQLSAQYGTTTSALECHNPSQEGEKENAQKDQNKKSHKGTMFGVLL